MFSVMGGFSAALGMDKVSIGTITGFYATEVALIFALGGAMFAAMTGSIPPPCFARILFPCCRTCSLLLWAYS